VKVHPLDQAFGYLLLGPEKLPARPSRLGSASHQDVLDQLGMGQFHDHAWLVDEPYTYGSSFERGSIEDARLAALLVCAVDDGGNSWAWEHPPVDDEPAILRIDHGSTGFGDRYLAPQRVAGSVYELLELWQEAAHQPYFVRSRVVQKVDLHVLTPHFDFRKLTVELDALLTGAGATILDVEATQRAHVHAIFPASHLFVRFSAHAPEITRASTNARISLRWLGAIDLAAGRALLRVLESAGFAVEKDPDRAFAVFVEPPPDLFSELFGVEVKSSI
jgi:hypothetical protein